MSNDVTFCGVAAVPKVIADLATYVSSADALKPTSRQAAAAEPAHNDLNPDADITFLPPFRINTAGTFATDRLDR